MSNPQSTTPFDNIESSHEYVSLLAKAVEEAIAEIEADISLSSGAEPGRRKEALQLVRFHLNKLSGHMTSSRRILNDLRTLRRLLLEERLMETALRRGA
jgi:hypothetical protein